MLPVKQESHLHYQGRSCKGKYFALHGERRALESSDLESNLGLGWGLWASGFGGGRARCLGGAREKQVPFDFALGGFASRNDIAQLISSDGRGQS